MRTAADALAEHRTSIRRIVEENGAENPRVFGSIVHGLATDRSDIDILVDAIEGRTTLIDLARIQFAIEAMTGFRADVVTPLDIHERFRGRVVAEAQPL
ncbi:MAG: nucleotidyltransferase domain-containing protein [Rhodoferax sp.]|nr:nucleotidyltransferase domain-containing protein [Rhodoferax sp.]